MASLPLVGPFNDAYISGLYESFLRDPTSVDESWRQFFRVAQSLVGSRDAIVGGGGPRDGTTDVGYLRKVAGAAGLVQAIRQYGHLDVQLDPLGSAPMGARELRPDFHGIGDSDLADIPAAALGFDLDGTAADVVAGLRRLYSSTIGFEFEHIEEEKEREWFRDAIERDGLERTFSPDQSRALLRRLTQVDGLERFLGRAFQGYKRFSIEGTDVLVPMLDAAIERAAATGALEVVIGMAHRGRINVLAHILDKPYATIFEEFEGKHAVTSAASDTGDVKYHLGARTERTLDDGSTVSVMLVPNPSHLEFVNPVVVGVARALQRENAKPGSGTLNESSVLPVQIHGDAAFPGEGVVAETFNLSYLRGYRTGGTLHIIANNQVGFTTDPRDGRSTYYASDLAKGFEVPIVHVNADDAESCVAVISLALAYRAVFGKDFLIDVVGYRRYGHNETDEPAYTQPLLYATIRAHPTPREVLGNRLVDRDVVTAADVKQIERDVMEILEKIHGDAASRSAGSPSDDGEGEELAPASSVDTSVPAEQLSALNEQMVAWPSDFKPVPKLAKQLERRRSALDETRDTGLGERGAIDWGHAESLAFASLLAEGTSVRLTGQDAERGTFSHRQAVLHDHETGATYTPLQHLKGVSAIFEIYNSPLSETAVLAFDYGYSVAAPEWLVLWEAQFGDFVNVAQPIIDQFIVADRAKWRQDSSLVLLLPHGYEGQGPEHSSARLERFLQSSAEGNLRVAYPSTPAQYFHILRRQARLADKRPLVLMQPKSLLRMPEASSRLRDLTSGGFQTVIDDAVAATRRAQVRRVVFCTGKLYYDLAMQKPGAHLALVRVEELYPWPHDAVAAALDSYSAATEVVWAQEEPRNMGAWTFVSQRLRAAAGNSMPVRYVGRPERASPAEGYAATHQANQARIVSEVLAPIEEPMSDKRRTPKSGQTSAKVRG